MANYSKTSKGVIEIEERKYHLSARLRRLLILIDGSKTPTDLEPFVPPGELRTYLAELEREGFITAGAGATLAAAAPAAASAQPPLALSPQAFLALRSGASHFLHDRMGPASDFACEKIERCKSPEELRTRLHEIEQMIARMLGPKVAQEFSRQFLTELG